MGLVNDDTTQISSLRGKLSGLSIGASYTSLPEEVTVLS